MSYFNQVSDLYYQSQLPTVKSSLDFIKVKNLFRRAKIRDEFFKDVTVFTKYTITGDERPDQIANSYYGSSRYDWIVLISNNIIDIKTEWPMNGYDFDQYLKRKYDPTEIDAIHHYETVTYYDGRGRLIVPSGRIVDPDFETSYYDERVGETKTISPLKSVSNYEYEVEVNNNKRTIYLLRRRFLQTAIDDMLEIMSYGFSSQFIDDKTKKGDNLRIISPR
jgi:hypothetical protein